MIYLLVLDENKKLEMAGVESSVSLVELSAYIFEKILDHLRLEGLFTKGLVTTTMHGFPVVRDAEKGRYEKTLKQLFPGDRSKIFENE